MYLLMYIYEVLLSLQYSSTAKNITMTFGLLNLDNKLTQTQIE